MRIVLFILSAFFLIIPAAHAQEYLKECSLKIDFGSYAHGIDISGYESIRKIIDNSAEVDTYTDIAWGKEGERTICVQTFSMSATDKLYETLITYVPNISDEYWTEIIHQDGRSQKTQWPESGKFKLPRP